MRLWKCLDAAGIKGTTDSEIGNLGEMIPPTAELADRTASGPW